jgi:hypothetical protein
MAVADWPLGAVGKRANQKSPSGSQKKKQTEISPDFLPRIGARRPIRICPPKVIILALNASAN